MEKEVIKIVLEMLEEMHPDPKCELIYGSPFQLLIATVLAAQATDRKVNEVTKELFKLYKCPEDFLELTEADLADKIKSINFYKTKAKNIMDICRVLVIKYKGQVPESREELVKLKGVGRKTANVVLSNAFDIPAIAVDTHVHRVANKIGLVETEDVLKTELELERLIPEEQWSKAHNYLVLHGRYVCNAKKPKCSQCKLASICRSHI